MINFFRKIRKQLADDNKPLKYARYAIGEIILVVFGILIALQINNWNENRNIDELEQRYLLALKEEFLLNRDEAKRVMDVSENIHKSSAKLDKWLNPTKIEATEKEVDNAMAASFALPPKYVDSPGLLNDLINSGNLNKLKSEKLRKLIQEWFIARQETRDEEEELWLHRHQIVDIIKHKMSFRRPLSNIGILSSLTTFNDQTKFSANNTEILKDRYFENIFIIYSITLNSLYIDFYPRLESISNSIIDEINGQLNE